MRGLLLFSLLLSIAYAQWEQCDGYDCLTKEELIAELKRAQAMRKEYFASMTSTATKSKRPSMLDVFDESTTWAGVTGTPASVQNQCNICSDPSVCLNGGTCQVDPTNPWGNYICDCPGNYTGTHCETLVKCEANTCGTNTTCSVSNHQTNCVCLPGYSGDPVKGCTARTRSSCTFGDPHYTTFDGLGYDYQGTCPLVFAQPCTTLGGGYDDFSVVHKNELIYPTAHLSAPAEVDIVMFGQQIHFDRISGSMYFNQVRVALPFHWPSSSDPKITLSLNGVTLTAASSQLVTVTLTRNSYPTLCVEVPDIPVFRGNALCGLAGNIDNNYHDDIICRNGSIFPITQSSNNPIASQAHDFNVCLDSWIVPEFFYTSTSSVCAPGALMGNVTSCPIPPAQAKCQPLADAMIGEGVFGQCQGMGNETIQRLYDACVFDLCYQSSLQCSTYTNFVEICQQMLPDTDLGPWRQNTSCIKQCGPNSEYSSCTSACPATCAQHDAPSTCNQGCVDGCECDYGFVADNTVTSRLSCIRIQDCGCEDPNGNIHSADQPWLDDDCTLAAICQNGTYFNETVSCGTYATCGSDSNHNMACQCEPGFTGNGFNCEDINECNDPNSCGAGQGLGSCQNTIGSYNCTCNMYQLGRDCQDFMPKRSCADLIRYWNKTEDGVYTLELPDWSSNSSGWFFDVYCDMTTDNGGWTLMSHDSGNMMSNKTFFDYQQGFGFPSDQNVWLGLEAITAMTNDFPTKLRLEIFRCYPPTGYDNMTECTYPSFTVLGAEEGYAVQIPEYCSGTETDTYSMFTRGTDGWVDWCIGSSCATTTGPAFSIDNICSETANDVGFWYNMAPKAQCGSANLNGNRFACNNAPLITSTDVLKWYRNTLGDVWMYLRPADFPNY